MYYVKRLCFKQRLSKLHFVTKSSWSPALVTPSRVFTEEWLGRACGGLNLLGGVNWVSWLREAGFSKERAAKMKSPSDLRLDMGDTFVLAQQLRTAFAAHPPPERADQALCQCTPGMGRKVSRCPRRHPVPQRAWKQAAARAREEQEAPSAMIPCVCGRWLKNQTEADLHFFSQVGGAHGSMPDREQQGSYAWVAALPGSAESVVAAAAVVPLMALHPHSSGLVETMGLEATCRGLAWQNPGQVAGVTVGCDAQAALQRTARGRMESATERRQGAEQPLYMPGLAAAKAQEQLRQVLGAPVVLKYVPAAHNEGRQYKRENDLDHKLNMVADDTANRVLKEVPESELLGLDRRFDGVPPLWLTGCTSPAAAKRSSGNGKRFCQRHEMRHRWQ